MSGNKAMHALLEHFFWLNMKNVEKSSATYHDEIEYDFCGPKGIQIKGKKEVSKIMAFLVSAMPNNKVHLKRILTIGDDAVVELASEEIDPKTGGPIITREILFWEMKDGKLYRLRAYRMDPGLFTGEFRESMEAVRAS